MIKFCARALSLVFAGLCVTLVSASEKVTIDGISYELNTSDHTAVVVSSPDFNDSALSIPGTINVNSDIFYVKSVGKAAFFKSSVSSVVLGEGIERLEAQSFANCASLVSLSLPKSLLYISNQSFWDCSYITDVYSYAQEPLAIGEDTFGDAIVGAQKRGEKTPKLHVPEGSSEVYKNAQYWNEFEIVEMVISRNKIFILNASDGGTLFFDDYDAHGSMTTVEVDGSAESVVVSAVPAHGYEFKSLTVTRRDGELIHYSFEHRGGDIIATIPLEDGMLVSASFVEPEVYNLQVKLGDGGRYDVPVNSDKSYSFKYAAPNGWAVSSVTFNDERMDVAGVGGNTVSITTPKLSEDSQLNIVIHDIQTGVERAMENAPIVRQISDRVIVEDLALGAEVFLTDSTGHTTVYHASGGVATIDALTDGVYLITTSGYTFKIRH